MGAVRRRIRGILHVQHITISSNGGVRLWFPFLLLSIPYPFPSLNSPSPSSVVSRIPAFIFNGKIFSWKPLLKKRNTIPE
jgi:hypothetical protein